VLSFVQQHQDKITGVLSCFDRLIFKGHLPISHAQGMAGFLQRHGKLLKDFKTFAPEQADRIKAHAQTLAEQAGRPYHYLGQKLRQEEFARELAQKDGVTEGLVCVLATLETTPSFAIAYGYGRPQLVRRKRRCLVVYFYYLEPEFGLIHVRLSTWFPLTIQVYFNGHEWLANAMDRAGLRYQRRDNAFTFIEHPERAQALADRLTKKHLRGFLDTLARRVNPLLKDLLKGASYYWVIDQAEFATDVLFRDRAALRDLYPCLLEHALRHFGAEDVLSFLGKKLDGRFRGDVVTDLKKRPLGYRIKHRVGGNWLKMYDKFGQVLRIEVVINQPRAFRIRRWGTRQGQRVLAWLPLNKSVVLLDRYAELSQAAARRYLDALAIVHDPQPTRRLLDRVCDRVPYRGRTCRPLNPLSARDQQLFRAVLRGEHALRGFAAKDVARELGVRRSDDPKVRRRHSARISRLLQLLHAHGLIAKIPNTRRYRATDKGFALMSMAIYLRHDAFPDALKKVA
jgi:hypothetical protein